MVSQFMTIVSCGNFFVSRPVLVIIFMPGGKKIWYHSS